MARHLHPHPTSRWPRVAAFWCTVLGAWFALCAGATAGDATATPDASASGTATLGESSRLFNAVVKIEARAVTGARSADSLGREREGTGIVIGDEGLVLTIGYLIVEAGEVRVVDSAGHALPARVIGYDHATGLGLVRTIGDLGARPVPLGDSGKLKERDPVMIVSHGGREHATLAYVVSRRAFTGNWEYLLDEAIYTAPPTLNWSGAALIGRDGALLGVGSLIVRDAMGGEAPVPGNVFVPIDLLKPMLDELIRFGKRAGPARPWLGINADEVQGRLVVSRVSPEGPADKAGLKPGDLIVGVGGETVRTQPDFYRRLWAYGSAGAEIPLRVLQDGLDTREIKVRSIDRVDYFRSAPVH